MFRRRSSSVSLGRGSRRSSSARATAPPGAARPSASGANVAPAASAHAPARRAAARPGRGEPVHRARRARRLELGPYRRGAARRLAGDQMRRDDRARGRADVVVAVAQVEAGAVLDPGQDAHHPGLAEDATAAEDEHVGS